MRPSASWPTPARGERAAIWSFVKSSSERNTGTEFRTSTGPPPSAATTFPQAGCRIRRAAICVPTGASAWSLAASEPVAWMTAPPGGIGSPPFAPTAVTTAERSTFGAAAGNDCSTISAEPWMAGAFGPNAGVSSTTCPCAATWLSPLSGRRCPVPCQVPKNLTRSTCSPPAESTPIDEREPNGGCASTPPDMKIPAGCPSLALKRSPLIPATVAWPETSFSICVTFSRPPSTVPRASTGASW